MTADTRNTSPIAWVYLAFSIVGAISTWSYNLQALRQFGAAFTPAAFVRVGFEGGPILGSLAADFWVGALASSIWMVSEGLRLKMKAIWVYVALALVIAWACALPLFLFMRERRLSQL